MKKFFVLIGVIAVLFSLVACGNGRADNVTLDLDSLKETGRFSDSEIDAAVDCMINDFEETNKMCELTEIGYDDSQAQAEGFADENKILFTSVFTVDNYYRADGLTSGTTQVGFKWYLTRESPEDGWVVESVGQG